MAEIYKNGETTTIFGWNPAVEQQLPLLRHGVDDPQRDLGDADAGERSTCRSSDDLWIWPIPTGPHGRLGLEHVMGCYNIWKFAQNKENAQQFLVDLCINYKQATDASQLYNFPSFPGAYPVQGRSARRPPRTRTSRAGSTRS